MNYYYIKYNTLIKYLIFCMLFIAFFYTSYRYPSMINSTGTSGTYSDTPFWISAARYVIVYLTLIIIIIVQYLKTNDFKIYKKTWILIYGYLFFTAIIHGIIAEELYFFKYGVFFLVPITLHMLNNNILAYKQLNKFISFVIYIALIVNIIQIILFIFYNRLPALAYTDTIFVRFGSFLDAPNEFGLLIPWFITFSIKYYWGKKKIIIVTGLVISLFITQSLTAIGVSIIVALLYILINLNRLTKTNFIRIIAYLFILVILISVNYIIFEQELYRYYQEIYYFYDVFAESKAKSIGDHISAIDILLDITVLNFIGLFAANKLGESLYINLLANFGFIYLCTYVFISIIFIYNSYQLSKKSSTREKKIFFIGMSCYFLSLLIGNVNINFSASGPHDLLQYLFWGLISNNLITEKT